MSDNDKYIVFRRDEFLAHATPKAVNEATAQMVYRGWGGLAIEDAVVIRRQDLFAAPALATYSACIAIAARLTSDKEEQKRLLHVADYFEDQARLAAEEGWKTPD